MSCTLTDKSLVVRKGLLNRIEATVPRKITDLALKQGPIMRAMGLHTLTIETAGGSGGTSGAPGRPDRHRRLHRVPQRGARRDRLEDRKSGGHASTHAASASSDTGVLEEIRDTLQRIERHLAEKH